MTKRYDVIIAGGGAVGASCAYQLSKRGNLRIALVDDKRTGNASRASAGGLWAIGESVGLGCGVIFARMMSKKNGNITDLSTAVSSPHILPDCFLEFALASNDMYPALQEELLRNHDMDCKFQRTGLKYIIYDENDRQYAQYIADQIPQLASELRWLDRSDLDKSEPALTQEAQGAIEFLCDHQLNPFCLTDAYLEGARQNGVDLFRQISVTDILHQGSRIVGVRLSEGSTLSCSTLINAAGTWAADLSEKACGVRLPVTPVKGQIALTERMPPLLKGCLTTVDCYIAQKDNGEILIGSTTEYMGFDTTTNIAALSDLIKGAVKCIPELGTVNLKRCWAGLRPGSPDELPILGPMPGIEGYMNACGHFRTGILTSALTGVILDSLINNLPLPIDIEPFLGKRFLKESPVKVMA